MPTTSSLPDRRQGPFTQTKAERYREPSSASELGITQLMPPDIPQYNGVIERAPGLLREKANALLEDPKKQVTGVRCK